MLLRGNIRENLGLLERDTGLMVSDISKEHSTFTFEGQGVQEDFSWLVS